MADAKLPSRVHDLRLTSALVRCPESSVSFLAFARLCLSECVLQIVVFFLNLFSLFSQFSEFVLRGGGEAMVDAARHDKQT